MSGVPEAGTTQVANPARPSRRAAIVGVGATAYYRRGESGERSTIELAVDAIGAACADAGVPTKVVDGFAYFNNGFDTGALVKMLGTDEVRFSATVTGGGNGSAGAVALARMAVECGQSDVAVVVIALRQPPHGRFGAALARTSGAYAKAITPEREFTYRHGIYSVGQLFSLIAKRHMHEYGTTRCHLAHVAMTQRAYASTRQTARFRDLMTLDDYFAAPMISEPLCLFDYTMETDGAAAVVVTTAERAAELRHTPVYVAGSAMGGAGGWGRGTDEMCMPDMLFPTSGLGAVAERVYADAGVGPDDIDVALFYDHFSPAVLLQLEDFGFCGRGESGAFVEAGGTKLDGPIPVNTHGGHLSEAYVLGMTHVIEGVEQLRGKAVNQVAGAQLALVTGGPSTLPGSAIILQGGAT